MERLAEANNGERERGPGGKDKEKMTWALRNLRTA